MSANTTSQPTGLINSTMDISPETIGPHQMDTIVNVTREMPLNYAIVMFGYLLPFVLIVSIVTNCLVVAVLYQRHMRTPTNIVLLMMAIVDLATLLSPSPWYLYIYTLGNHDKFLYPPAACYAHHLMTDVVPVFFHTSSIWLALLLASQRYIYVCHPTLARTWCTVPRVKRAICAILAVAFLHQLSRFFDNTFIAVKVVVNKVFHMACRIEIAEWVHTLDVPRYYTTYYTFRILFVFIFPCTALITLNWLLFRALKRAETKRTMLLRTRFKIVGADPTQAAATTAERVSSPNIFAANRSQTTNYVTRALATTTATTGGAIQLAGGHQQQRRRSELSGARQKANLDEVDGDNRRATRHDGPDSPPISASIVRARCSASNLVDSTQGRNLAHLPILLPNKQAELKSAITSRVEAEEQARGQLDRVIKQTTTATTTTTTTTTTTSATNKDGGAKRRRRSGMSRASGANSSVYSDNQSRTSASSGRSSHDVQSDSHTSRSASSRSSTTTAQTTKTDDDDDDEDDGDLSTCAECAAEFRRSCRRCSMALGGVITSAGSTAAATEEELNTNTSAICEHQHKTIYQQQHKRLLHQPVSQCSSILGGATNTTNDEDNSSCLATQNMSSSMLAPAAATLDAIETSSMHCSEGDVDEEVRVEEPALDCELELASLDGMSPTPTGEKLFELSRRLPNFRPHSELARQLMKSESIGSRLACDCLGGKAVALRRINSLNKAGRNSRDLPPASSAQTTGNGALSCWTPDEWPARRLDRTADMRAIASKGLAELRSDRGSEMNGDQVEARTQLSSRQQRDSGQTMAFQPTKTTTTTLISVGSSAGSLNPAPSATNTHNSEANSSHSQQRVLMVSQKPDSEPAGDQLSVYRTQNQPETQQRTESPLFARLAPGRGSRTTLLGSSNTTKTHSESIPIIVAGTSQSNSNATPHQVTTRSMDSNRTTLMLVVVVTVFLFVEVPVALMTIAHVILNTFDVFKDFDFDDYLIYIKLITNFMIMVSYSVNFTIYCSMSKRFRETFRDLFDCSRTSPRRRSKRIFSQSQAGNCNQFSVHPIGPASTMMTSMINHNTNNQSNSNHQNHLSLHAARSSKQLTDFSLAASDQNLITSGQSLTRRHNERNGNHYECEL